MTSKYYGMLILFIGLALSGCDKETQPQTPKETTEAPVVEAPTSEAPVVEAPAVEATEVDKEKDSPSDKPFEETTENEQTAPLMGPKWVDELPEGYKCPEVHQPPPRNDVVFRSAATPARAGTKGSRPVKIVNADGIVMAEVAAPDGTSAGDAAKGGYAGMNSADIQALKNYNTEEYSNYDPNRFVNVQATPLSTFGADVDTASYSIFRRKVNDGCLPAGLALRSEEMINYFKYDYPEPKAGEPFSVTTEISDCPWNNKTKLLQIGFKTRKLTSDEMPPSNIVFLLDVSGSMHSWDRLPLLKTALLNMLPDMFLRDRISIVTYASDQRLVLEGASAKYCRSEIASALDGLNAGGFTAGGRGIQMAYETAEKHFIKGGNNRVILGTDGDLNVGISSATELKEFIEKKRDSGIFLTVLGFGMGNYKDNRLETLADYGNGSYHYIDSILEARRVLVDERSQTLFVAAKDVKFQVEFNPAKIKGYRQIGYETRKLAAEDFADDTKDGGEVGAGHQVTVLYELVETDSDVQVPEVKTKYQKQETVQSDEWLTVNVRYKEPDGKTSRLLTYPVDASSFRAQMSENMKLAAAAAATAMIANESPFKGEFKYSDVLTILNGMASIKSDAERAEFRSLVEKLNTSPWNCSTGHRRY